jgi:hypothetical protein
LVFPEVFFLLASPDGHMKGVKRRTTINLRRGRMKAKFHAFATSELHAKRTVNMVLWIEVLGRMGGNSASYISGCGFNIRPGNRLS